MNEGRRRIQEAVPVTRPELPAGDEASGPPRASSSICRSVAAKRKVPTACVPQTASRPAQRMATCHSANREASRSSASVCAPASSECSRPTSLAHMPTSSVGARALSTTTATAASGKELPSRESRDWAVAPVICSYSVTAALQASGSASAAPSGEVHKLIELSKASSGMGLPRLSWSSAFKLAGRGTSEKSGCPGGAGLSVGTVASSKALLAGFFFGAGFG
mmetsp:Transcript_122458/g.307917  ORF Transcript_122458/g.307917 Transcript_122458/m.307917 type:complete len:221 (+) Transcript_122458:302-964(+)